MLVPVGIVRWEQVVFAVAPPPDLAGPEHRSRALQERELAGSLTATGELRSEYDAQAPGWIAWTRGQPDYLAPLRDALDRSSIGESQVSCVMELAAGSGPATTVLAERWGSRVVAVDVSWEMLIRSRPDVVRVQADARALPFLGQVADLVVVVNGVVHWSEIWRILAPRGKVLLVSSYGASTPLYTSVQQVAADVGDRATDMVTSAAGHGEWVLVNRQESTL